MSARDIASLVRSGERSAVEVTREALARVDERDASLSAFVHGDGEGHHDGPDGDTDTSPREEDDDDDGCGCDVGADGGSPAPAAALLGAIALLGLRRRQR